MLSTFVEILKHRRETEFARRWGRLLDHVCLRVELWSNIGSGGMRIRPFWWETASVDMAKGTCCWLSKKAS